jgi:hypothetical protein
MNRAIRHALPVPLLLAAALSLAPGRSLADQPAAGVWYGADGEPLPFASPDEIESFLETAEIVSNTGIDTGRTGPRELLLEQNGVRARAVFKDVDEVVHRGAKRVQGLNLFNARDYHLFDCAAYRLDRLLGLGRVPPSVPREVRGRAGTVTLWLEHTLMEKDRRSRGLDPPDPFRWEQQKRILQVFDALVGNFDSNLGNILIDRTWTLWFIDHTRSFVSSGSLFHPDRLKKCERRLYRALEGLGAEEVRRELGPFLTGAEIDALLARREAILERLRAQIDDRGENLVLFDLRPPGKKLGEW